MPVDFNDPRIDWDALDVLVLSGQRVQFLARVCDAADVDLKEAMDALQRRYDLLRRSRPHDFTQTHEEYWKDFYS